MSESEPPIAEGVKLLRRGAENPAGLLEAAAFHDPDAAALCNIVSGMAAAHVLQPGSSASSTLLLMAAAVGRLHGLLIDPNKNGATVIADAFREQLEAVMKHSAEAGYARNLKENENARTRG